MKFWEEALKWVFIKKGAELVSSQPFSLRSCSAFKLCPSSCAIVKATARPVSSLILPVWEYLVKMFMIIC